MKVYTNINEFKVRKPVVAVGMFDGLHLGHKLILNQVKETAEKVGGEAVIMTFSPHPRIVLGHDGDLCFLNTIEEKTLLMKQYGIAHFIVYPFTLAFSKLTSSEFISEVLVQKLNIHTLIVGYNHHFGRNRENKIENLRSTARPYGFAIEKCGEFAPTSGKVSSSIIRNLLSDGNVQKAAEYLSYPFFLYGKVVEGDKIGRTIGYPTANLHIGDKSKLIPKNGVYAVWVHYNEVRYKGMMNIGLRPTITSGGPEKRIEVHLLFFSGNLYGETLRVSFIEKIRDEKRYENLEALKKQLASDEREANCILGKSAIDLKIKRLSGF